MSNILRILRYVYFAPPFLILLVIAFAFMSEMFKREPDENDNKQSEKSSNPKEKTNHKFNKSETVIVDPSQEIRSCRVCMHRKK